MIHNLRDLGRAEKVVHLAQAVVIQIHTNRM